SPQTYSAEPFHERSRAAFHRFVERFLYEESSSKTIVRQGPPTASLRLSREIATIGAPEPRARRRAAGVPEATSTRRSGRHFVVSDGHTSSVTRFGATTSAGRWSGVSASRTVRVLPAPMSRNIPARGWVRRNSRAVSWWGNNGGRGLTPVPGVVVVVVVIRSAPSALPRRRRARGPRSPRRPSRRGRGPRSPWGRPR